MLDRVRAHPEPWDMIIAGGGATGVGIAVDAAACGYDVLLLEQDDFGKGTSSRSTKLVHGGVRYLEQGNVSLVIEALRERGLLLKNAPHLVRNLGFVLPSYRWWEVPFYGLGLKMYSLLAGKYGFGDSRILSREETIERLPTIRTEGLRGGVIYFDGQFDDSRLLIHLVMTACEQGATLLNYVRVTGVTRDERGVVSGILARDMESGEEFRARARVVVNATGVFSDELRLQANPHLEPMITPSQGIHLVFDRSFLPGDSAIMVPHTSDGRVMFAIPWEGHTLVGTTDTPLDKPALEPVALEEEIEFILRTASLYLCRKPTRDAILSLFAGIRPLVRSRHTLSTAALSREHTIHMDDSGLLTICGGKWTTYRQMAEDCVSRAAKIARLAKRPCVTRHLKIHGYDPDAERLGPLSVYGSDAPAIKKLANDNLELARPLDESLPYIGAEVVWAVRHEMARTVEDVLARRTRALFLNARAARRMAPKVAELMRRELDRDKSWTAAQISSFTALTNNYLPA